MTVLSAFAFTQPIFDVLGNNAEFFLAHDTLGSNLLLFALIVGGLIPILTGIITLLVGLLPEYLARPAYLCLTGVLLLLICLPFIERAGISATWGVLIALGAAVAGSALLSRYSVLQRFLLYFLPALLIFPAWFLLGTPAAGLIWGESNESLGYEESHSEPKAPVVILIFDELPLSSLLDDKGSVDPVRYPNFARLARESTWYRNASTISESTHYAVPALLSGKYPVPGKLPVYLENPQNLFLLLSGRGKMISVESVTQLCPPGFCQEIESGRPFKRWRTLLVDTGLTYLHLILPRWVSLSLPPVDKGWAGFLESHSSEDMNRMFSELERQLSFDPDRPLIFLHLQTPHLPWYHLPSGQTHMGKHEFALPIEDNQWTDDTLAVTVSYQLHLLEVGYTDTLLGRILEILERSGLYDRSWLAVVSDHGVAFRPGAESRAAVEGQFRQILNVPCFVKRPFQEKAEVSELNVELVDLLPSLAADLGIEIPWKMDGKAFSTARKSEKRVYRLDRVEPVLLDANFLPLRKQAICVDGRVRPLEDFSGWLDVFEDRGKEVLLHGWAANTQARKCADRIHLMVDGELQESKPVDNPSPSVATFYQIEELDRCGFEFVLPSGNVMSDSDIRFVAELDGKFWQLRYRSEYPWLVEFTSRASSAENPCPVSGTHLVTLRGVDLPAQLRGNSNPSVTHWRQKAGAGGLFPFLNAEGLLGRNVPAEIESIEQLSIRLVNGHELQSVDPESDFLPCTIHGRITGAVFPEMVAVALNGRIEAVAAIYLEKGHSASLTAFLRPEALRTGYNKLEFLACSNDGRILSRIPFR